MASSGRNYRKFTKAPEALRFDEIAGGSLSQQLKVRSVICWADAYRAAFNDMKLDPPSMRAVLQKAINRLGLDEDDLNNNGVSLENCRQAYHRAKGVLKD